MRRLLQAQYPPPDVIRNGRWHQGQSSSLVCGLSRLPRSCPAALILLTDQPQIKAQDLRRLAIAWRRRPGVPAAAAYAGRVGVPAILPRRHFAAARKLKGDVGARAILRGAPRLTTVAIESAAFDLDTPADLDRLNSLNQRLRFGTAA
jgi:molybdenum cofactor cytidylyltransferase